KCTADRNGSAARTRTCFRTVPASPTTRRGVATIWIETAANGPSPGLQKYHMRLFFRPPPAFPGNSPQPFVDHGRAVLRYGLGRTETTWPRRSRSPGASLPFVPGESREARCGRHCQGVPGGQTRSQGGLRKGALGKRKSCCWTFYATARIVFGAIGSKRLTPGTPRSYFRPPPNVLKNGAPGDRWRASRGTLRFVDPSPDPHEPRRQRHPRNRHHGHDASHVRGYGFCPKHFRGAVRPPGAFFWPRAGRQFHGARQAGTG